MLMKGIDVSFFYNLSRETSDQGFVRKKKRGKENVWNQQDQF